MYNSEPRKDEVFRIDSGEDDARADSSGDSYPSEGWQCFRHVPYLTEEAKANLRKYKYAGGDDGLMYRYFYNPLAKWLVSKVPEWVAPNLITLAGFAFSAVPFVLIFAIFGTHLYNEAPVRPVIQNWVFFAEGLCYFAYRLLDEMDGKQARRTGNSSPLGLLFDHGCDAFAVGLQCLIIAKLAQMGPAGILFVHGSNAIFHFCTLEEYYMGGLFLAGGNPISDGSLLYYVIMLSMAIFGNEFFVAECFAKDYLYEGSRPIVVVHLVLFVSVAVQTCTVAASVRKILAHKREVAQLKEKGEIPESDGEELNCRAFTV